MSSGDEGDDPSHKVVDESDEENVVVVPPVLNFMLFVVRTRVGLGR